MQGMYLFFRRQQRRSGSWVLLPPMPEVGISDILGLVATMLGNSMLRTIEKSKGVAS